MRFFCAVLLLCVSAVLANPRGKRNACQAVFDFYSRKSCNYIQAAVVDCTEKLVGECYTPDEVAGMQAQQFAGVLQQLEAVEEWDSDKCPASKKYKEGLDGETDEGSAADDQQTAEGDDPTDDVAPEDTPAPTDEDTPAPTAEDTTENPPAGDTGAEGEGNGDDTSAAGALVAAPLLVLLLARLV